MPTTTVPKWILLSFVVAGFVVVIINMGMVNTITHHISETLETNFRNSRFHGDIQRLSNSTKVTLPHNDVTYLYVHVPRTGGDSMAVHMFPATKEESFHSSLAWWGGVGVPNLYEELKSDDNFHGPKNFKRLYKGFFSRDNVEFAREEATKRGDGSSFDTNAKVIKMFTILRHPHERLVSSYKHFKKWGDVVCDGTFDSFIAQCNATQPLQCRDDLNFWSDQIKHRTFARDSLLYQLGNVMR